MSTYTLVSELERLANALEADRSGCAEVSMAAIAERIAHALGVKTEEVAILGVSQRWRHLYFFVPQALKSVGFIPLSSTSALAARTVRENRSEINNTFFSVRHATVFEGVKAPTTSGEAIQKIISAPLLREGNVVGVLQISRKGNTLADAGPDFTAHDLENVLTLCPPLGKLVGILVRE